jgi:hypothetical protein
MKKKRAIDSSTESIMNIFYKDEDNNEINVTADDLTSIVKDRRFPEKMKALVLNEFEIDTTQEPYRTTFTDKIEFDAKDSSVHSNNICSISIAEVTWLGERKLISYHNATSTIADQIIRSYKWNGFYIVARHKNNYSLDQYMKDARSQKRVKPLIIEPHRVIRKLGLKIRKAHNNNYGKYLFSLSLIFNCLMHFIIYFSRSTNLR